MRVIVALSGGKASAWCAGWALRNFNRDDVVLYFNDTKWEHQDLYRFLDDLSLALGKPVTYDSDGRSPEQLFHDKHALANNRMPFCSRILKAERLQKFYQHEDRLVFGIGMGEAYRVARIIGTYQKVAVKTERYPFIHFPLIDEKVTPSDVNDWLGRLGVRPPGLYALGFSHNNCSGGCVRAGKRQWKHLLETLPEVYLDRERVEEDMRKKFGKDISFFKDETLQHFRGRVMAGDLSAAYDDEKDTTPELFECVGVCQTEN